MSPWRECEHGECAELGVPLDYADPTGAKIKLALARVVTADPAKRIGNLFVNPGGPGAPGRDLGEYVAAVLPDAILDRFDIVAWDPRGSGASSPVRCGRRLDYLFNGDTAPDDPAELGALQASAQRFVNDCVERSGDLLARISTRATVRDLDRLRGALGDEQLTYLGFSYGTYIGAMYASMFPDRVRALVLDGAVDPQVSAEDLSIEQANGFGESLQKFFEWCEQRDRCAFHHEGRPREAFAVLKREIDGNPIGVGVDRFGPVQLDVAVAALLYGGDLGYRTLAGGLRDLEDGSTGALTEVVNVYLGRDDRGRYNSEWAAFIAISCADGPNLTVAAMEALQRRAAVEAPDFGAGNVGLGYACSFWPHPPDRSGPITFAAPTAAPIVVIGTTGDPATPLIWSEAMATQLQSGRLVTVTGTTHTSVLNGDRCLDRILVRYLVRLAPPSPDSRC